MKTQFTVRSEIAAAELRAVDNSKQVVHELLSLVVRELWRRQRKIVARRAANAKLREENALIALWSSPREW